MSVERKPSGQSLLAPFYDFLNNALSRSADKLREKSYLRVLLVLVIAAVAGLFTVVFLFRGSFGPAIFLAFAFAVLAVLLLLVADVKAVVRNRLLVLVVIVFLIVAAFLALRYSQPDYSRKNSNAEQASSVTTQSPSETTNSKEIHANSTKPAPEVDIKPIRVCGSIDTTACQSRRADLSIPGGSVGTYENGLYCLAVSGDREAQTAVAHAAGCKDKRFNVVPSAGLFGVTLEKEVLPE